MSNLVNVFRHPATIIISGPSGSGKSNFVKQLILNSADLIKTEDLSGVKGFDLVIVLYKIWTKLYENLQECSSTKIVFYKDTISESQLEKEIIGFKTPVLWVDDGLSDENVYFIEDVFTRYSHHLNLSCILLTHNLYGQKKNTNCLRTINRNAQYIIIFNYPRDRMVSRVLTQQSQSTKVKAKCLLQTIEKTLNSQPYGYFLLDFTQRTPEALRYKTNIFCENALYPIVFTFGSPETI